MTQQTRQQLQADILRAIRTHGHARVSTRVLAELFPPETDQFTDACLILSGNRPGTPPEVAYGLWLQQNGLRSWRDPKNQDVHYLNAIPATPTCSICLGEHDDIDEA